MTLTGVGSLALLIAASARAEPPVASEIRAPMACSQGPNREQLAVRLSLPASVAVGSTFVVRIDGVPSEKIAHAGLEYIHDMGTDYRIPPGSTYVPGSARIVPGTGTPNVAAQARVSFEAGQIRVLLPGRVASGSTYTPPSIEFRLATSAPVGTRLTIGFTGYRVTAHAAVIGDVHTTCRPNPQPFAIGSTFVIAR
jgi:hypothetical protein